MTREGTRAAPKVRWLDGAGLARLTDAWEIWAGGAGSVARAVARARLHLFFLLARFGGLRSSEIRAFNESARLDCETGLLQLKDRKLFLPPQALRFMRRILSLPEASHRDFLRLDDGFLRRTFYEIAAHADLPPSACAPRALRYGRAAELLALHVPPQLVAASLGLPDTFRFADFLPPLGAPNRPNCFPARIAAIETDLRAGRVFLQARGGLELAAVAPLDELADIEAAAGKNVQAAIAPGLIIPSPKPLPVANRIHCKCIACFMDGIEARLRLKTKGGLELIALADAACWSPKASRETAEMDVFIPAHAIRLAAE